MSWMAQGQANKRVALDPGLVAVLLEPREYGVAGASDRRAFGGLETR
jgi:hypothetical protein